RDQLAGGAEGLSPRRLRQWLDGRDQLSAALHGQDPAGRQRAHRADGPQLRAARVQRVTGRPVTALGRAARLVVPLALLLGAGARVRAQTGGGDDLDDPKLARRLKTRVSVPLA